MEYKYYDDEFIKADFGSFEEKQEEGLK